MRGQLTYNCLRTKMYYDIMLVKVKSKYGNTFSQLFVNNKCFFYLVTMTLKYEE